MPFLWFCDILALDKACYLEKKCPDGKNTQQSCRESEKLRKVR